MSSNKRILQFLDLPLELIHKILSLLSPIELATSQLLNKYLNAIISESLILQYAIALAQAKADDNPCSVVPLPQKLEDIRSSEAAWASLQPKFIASLPVTRLTSGIYDLSAGTYLLGNADMMALQYLQLPTQVGDPLDWKRITVNKVIIDMGFCVFEHDLIAIITCTPSTIQAGLLDIEMDLLEYSTGRPHPRADSSTIFITISSTLPALLCEIVGDNLVLILNFKHDVQLEDRVFIWNWRTSVLKTAFLAPYHTYSGILFLDEDLIILPNAKSAAFDFFRIPTKPTADTLKPVFSLQLPSLADGMSIKYITCRAEPNPIPNISRLNKRQRAQERADVGMDEVDPFAPKRGFLASGEDAICIFQIQFRTGEAVQDFLNVLPQPSYTLFVHRSSFLKMARQYEETPRPIHYEGQADSLEPRRIPWVDWGPPVSRWFNTITTPNRWITTSAGQRCAMIHGDVGTYGRPITVLDFNPFNIRKMKAKFEREMTKGKQKLQQELWSIDGAMEGVDHHLSVSPRETVMADFAYKEGRPLSASDIGELLSPSAHSQERTETTISPDMHMEADSESTSMDVGDDDDDQSWVTMDDDSNIFVGHMVIDADSDDSMPGLESADNSDDDCYTHSAYATNPQDHRHPGLALCRVLEAPSRISPGTFAEEVEGRLPYLECISEREYNYHGVLLDEERMLGITTDRLHRISVIDIFYFG